MWQCIICSQVAKDYSNLARHVEAKHLDTGADTKQNHQAPAFEGTVSRKFDILFWCRWIDKYFLHLFYF
jgi:hypothetical protein